MNKPRISYIDRRPSPTRPCWPSSIAAPAKAPRGRKARRCAPMCPRYSGHSPTAGATCSRTASPITPSRNCAGSTSPVRSNANIAATTREASREQRENPDRCLERGAAADVVGHGSPEQRADESADQADCGQQPGLGGIEAELPRDGRQGGAEQREVGGVEHDAEKRQDEE